MSSGTDDSFNGSNSEFILNDGWDSFDDDYRQNNNLVDLELTDERRPKKRIKRIEYRFGTH